MSSKEITFSDDEKVVSVENMMDHEVGYVLISSNVRRRFSPHVTMSIKVSELRELSYQRGGLVLLQNYLRILDPDVAREFGVDEDTIEYWWTEEDIVQALTNKPIEVLLDALDFGPEGIVQMLKSKAIELEIPDNRRIQAISARTNSNIASIIKNKHVYDAEDGTTATAKTRRTASTNTSRPKRRVQS